MAVFSIDNYIAGHNNDFVSRAGLIAPSRAHWALLDVVESVDFNQPTPIKFNIYESKNLLYLWVNQDKLFSGAPNTRDSSAQFIISTIQNPSDPSSSYIQISSVAFSDPRIVAADFSGGSPNLIITDLGTPGVVSVFQRNGQRISVTDPLGTSYYWDVDPDDLAVILTSQSSEAVEYSLQEIPNINL